MTSTWSTEPTAACNSWNHAMSSSHVSREGAIDDWCCRKSQYNLIFQLWGSASVHVPQGQADLTCKSLQHLKGVSLFHRVLVGSIHLNHPRNKIDKLRAFLEEILSCHTKVLKVPASLADSSDFDHKYQLCQSLLCSHAGNTSIEVFALSTVGTECKASLQSSFCDTPGSSRTRCSSSCCTTVARFTPSAIMVQWKMGK